MAGASAFVTPIPGSEATPLVFDTAVERLDSCLPVLGLSPPDASS